MVSAGEGELLDAAVHGIDDVEVAAAVHRAPVGRPELARAGYHAAGRWRCPSRRPGPCGPAPRTAGRRSESRAPCRRRTGRAAAEFAPLQQEAAVGGELLDPAVALVGDVDAAVRGDSDAARQPELPV